MRICSITGTVCSMSKTPTAPAPGQQAEHTHVPSDRRVDALRELSRASSDLAELLTFRGVLERVEALGASEFRVYADSDGVMVGTVLDDEYDTLADFVPTAHPLSGTGPWVVFAEQTSGADAYSVQVDWAMAEFESVFRRVEARVDAALTEWNRAQ